MEEGLTADPQAVKQCSFINSLTLAVLLSARWITDTEVPLPLASNYVHIISTEM